jgi:hypothetical protein
MIVMRLKEKQNKTVRVPQDTMISVNLTALSGSVAGGLISRS